MSKLIKPIITEKSMASITEGRYVFEVVRKANKAEIAQAIFEQYKVKPRKINVISVRGEEKLIRGRYRGKIRPTKKAIITLKKGDKIPGFEEK